MRYGDLAIYSGHLAGIITTMNAINESSLSPAEATLRYAAFISYRHLPGDTEIARKVQRFIESFKLPRDLALPQNATWPHPGSTLGKCFRDEDELAASPSLPKSIDDALARSHSLIVICSPETEQSTWVRQEIDTFIRYHGRERVICVLASGSSESSIPSMLKSHFEPDVHGAIREMPFHPLAADLRSNDRTSENLELLKVVAGIAGCGLDDLRRREKARRQRRVITFALSAIAIMGFVSALSFHSYRASQDALIAESKSLAALSQEQFSRGERLQALETVLAALPESAERPNRPIVEDAVTALEAVLELDTHPPKLWHPTFAADLNEEIVSIESNPSGGWVAALDASGIVSVFDALTGHELSSINLRQFAFDPVTIDAWTWTMKAAGPDNLLIASAAKDCDFVCVDVRRNQVVWDFGPLPIDGLAVSDDGAYCAVATITDESNPLGQGDLIVAVLNSQDGTVVYPISTNCPGFFVDIDPHEVDEDGEHVLNIFHPFALSNDESISCFGAGKFVAILDKNRGYAFYDFGNVALTSLAISDAYLLGATYDVDYESFPQNCPYSFGAYDISESTFDDSLWTVQGVFSPSISGEPFNNYSYFGLPTIQCIILTNGHATAVCSAGNTLRLLEVENGNELHTEVFPSSIVSVGSLRLSESDGLVVALSNGSLDFLSPLELFPYVQNDTYQCSIPYQIEDAIVEEFEGSIVVAAIKPANQPDRLLCYRFDLGYDDPVDYSLDELLAQAHELLEAE